MTAKFTTTRYVRLAILLAVVGLQSCINALPTDFPALHSLNWQQTPPFDRNGGQNKRNLRIHILADEGDSSDERGLNVGVSSITKFKGLTTSATQKLQKFVASAKMKMSSNNQLATDKLFTKLNVGNSESKLLESAEFQNWYHFVTKAYKKNVEEGEIAMVTTLSKHYSDGALINQLDEAKRTARTLIIANKLEDAQLTKWLTEEKSVGNVFSLLKLDETGEKLFESPLTRSWVRYTNKFQNNPDEAMFSTLKAHMDDKTLAKMLITTKDGGSVNTISAIKLEKVELEYWFHSGKTSDNIFNLLNLNEETGNLLKSPAFHTWVSYVTKVDTESPYDTVFAKLLTRYGDQNVVKLIFAEGLDRTTSEIAGKLAVVQLHTWGRGGQSPDDVFKLLSLQKEEGVDLLTSTSLRAWTSYVKFLKLNPDELLLKEMRMRNSDGELVHMFVTAKKDHNSITTAERLRVVLQKNWIAEGKSAEDVFKLLKLQNEGESMFMSAMWNTWRSYVTTLNKGDPDASMYLVLKAVYGEENLKTMIDTANKNFHTKSTADKLQEGAWVSEGKTADDIFTLLKLDVRGAKLFESPLLSTWNSYVTKLEKLKEKPDEFVAISYLENRIGRFRLARMLGKENQETTMKVVGEFQNLQFKKWMNNVGLEPTRLQQMLKSDMSDVVGNLKLSLAFGDYYKNHGGIPLFMYHANNRY